MRGVVYRNFTSRCGQLIPSLWANLHMKPIDNHKSSYWESNQKEKQLRLLFNEQAEKGWCQMAPWWHGFQWARKPHPTSHALSLSLTMPDTIRDFASLHFTGEPPHTPFSEWCILLQTVGYSKMPGAIPFLFPSISLTGSIMCQHHNTNCNQSNFHICVGGNAWRYFWPYPMGATLKICGPESRHEISLRGWFLRQGNEGEGLRIERACPRETCTEACQSLRLWECLKCKNHKSKPASTGGMEVMRWQKTKKRKIPKERSQEWHRLLTQP